MHIHFCFAVAKDKSTLIDSPKPSLQFNFENQEQFASWLGQALANMLDLYRQAETNSPEIKDSVVDLFKDPNFMSIRSWVASNLTKEKLEQIKLLNLRVSLKLGNAYSRMVDLIQKYEVKLFNSVDVHIEIDNSIGEHDKSIEFIQ